jgi:glycosyltransferase involved in cell wall biosynthesis
MDALMQGRVILCNDIEGIVEMIDPENNYIVELNSNSILKSIYSIIKEIKDNPDSFKKRGIRNKQFAINRYSSERVTSQYITLYNKLLK